MQKTYRIAAIGFAHVHMNGNIKSFAKEEGRVNFVAAADIAPDVESISGEKGTRTQQLAEAEKLYGFKHYDSYQELLDANAIDIALVCCENAYHPQVLETLLRKGIHVVVEKPLAMTMDGALRIQRAAREGNAKVITNWPSAWMPPVRTAKRIVDSGAIGKVLRFSYRNLDSLGPFSYGQTMTDTEKAREWWYRAEAGGGAIMDYCGYGANMAAWFLEQQPQTVSGIKANFLAPYGDTEDYAAMTVRFPQTIALLEGSWATVNSGVPNGPIVYGDKGTLVARQNGTVEVYLKRHSEEPDQVHPADPLPPGRDNLARETLNHLDTGEPLHPMLDLPLNITTVSILDAGIRSTVSGKTEPAAGGIWHTGIQKL